MVEVRVFKLVAGDSAMKEGEARGLSLLESISEDVVSVK